MKYRILADIEVDATSPEDALNKVTSHVSRYNRLAGGDDEVQINEFKDESMSGELSVEEISDAD